MAKFISILLFGWIVLAACGQQETVHPTPLASVTELPATMTRAANEASTDTPSPAPTEIPAGMPAPSGTSTASPTIPPTKTLRPSPTPVVFLTVVAGTNGCLLPPSVVLPVDSRGQVNPVLTGISGPDEWFCVMWDNHIPDATAFVIEISYMTGELFTQTVPANVSYTILPEQEAPNCTDRTSYQVTVHAIVNESNRLVGGMAVSDGCR